MLPGSPEAAGVAAKDAAEAECLTALAGPNPHAEDMNLADGMEEDGAA